MNKKTFLTVLVCLAGSALLMAGNPDKKKSDGHTGADNPKEQPKTQTASAAKPVVKQKAATVIQKKSDTYEFKAPSVFTFTVLNTYLNMPLQKK